VRAIARFGGEQQRAGAVVEAGGIAGGDRAFGGDDRRQRRELFQRVSGRGCSSATHSPRASAPDRRDLRGQAPRRGARGALLAAQRVGVLVGARDAELAARFSAVCAIESTP
jgi:hypothetical protein